MTVIPKAPGRPKKVWSPEELALKEAKEAALKAQKALEKEEKAMVRAQEKAAKEQARAAAKEAAAAQKAAAKAAKAAGLPLPLPLPLPLSMGGSMHAMPVGLDGHHQPPNVEALMAEILQCHMRLGALLGALHNAGHGMC
jgi:multidrug efflux pump subunit AcrA (membrane-fusion protein)